MRLRPLCFSIVVICGASAASADAIEYHLSANTSSISGTSGSLDLQFNPGPSASQTASLQILNFATSGTLGGSPSVIGDVSGSLPGTLTFDNGTGFNDYFQNFTFGTTLSFDISLFGPALSSPDKTSTSGSTLAFSMFSDAAGTVPALTTDMTDGFAFRVDVNLGGTTTLTNFSSQTTIASPNSPVPEPRIRPFLGTALGLMFSLHWACRTRRVNPLE